MTLAEYKAAWFQRNKTRLREKEIPEERRARVDAYKKQWYAENKERISQEFKKKYNKTRVQRLEQRKKQYPKLADQKRAYSRNRYAQRSIEEKKELWKIAAERDKQFPHIAAARVAIRRARKLRATPQWLSKDQRKLIVNFYSFARVMKRITGITHHVDHIVPLRSKLVCGLHVPWNLQVITCEENIKKSNKL